MSLFKRGSVYWFEFVHNGRRYRRTTKQGSRREAEKIESTFRSALAKRDVGIIEPELVPVLTSISPASAETGSDGIAIQLQGSNLNHASVARWNGADLETRYASAEKLTAKIPAAALRQPGTAAITVFNTSAEIGSSPKAFTITRPLVKEFAQTFISAVQTRSADKPATVQFYANKLARLLEYAPLANSRIDLVDEAIVDSYINSRRDKKLATATINRELATLRRMLRVAHQRRLVDRTPRVQLLSGENCRDFVLSYQQERLYVATAPQPLADVAAVLLETGLRIGELLALECSDVHIKPADGARYGYLRVRGGKTRNARRNVSLTAAANAVLGRRLQVADRLVFTNEQGTGPLSIFTVEDQHARTRALLKLPRTFVIHGLRHTFLTRLGEAGADAFTLMRVAGHSAVTVSQRYVHPSPEAQERAVERLENLNTRSRKELPQAAQAQFA